MKRHRISSRSATAFDLGLISLCLIETGCVFWFNKGLLGPVTNAVLFAGASLLFAALFFFRFYNRPIFSGVRAGRAHGRRRYVVAAAALLTGLLVFGLRAASIFRDMPYDKFSDIILTIEVAVNRLLNGDTVYRDLTEWGDNLPLTYLPAHWLPFTLAEWLAIDYRWVAVAIYAAGTLVVLGYAARSRLPLAGVMVLTGIFGAALLYADTGIIAMTVELMVAGYYMLFVSQLAADRPVLKGLIIAVCLMSRFILVLWLPLWLFVELVSANRRAAFTTVGVAALTVLGIYVIPFLSRDWSALPRGLNYYSHAAEGEWGHINDAGLPRQLDNGLGFARLFYQKLHWYSVPDRIRSLQKAQLAVSAGSVVAMGFVYWLMRSRVSRLVFLLTSFKIYLCLFLAFIQVPYPYLMITNIAVSIAMIGMLPLMPGLSLTPPLSGIQARTRSK